MNIQSDERSIPVMIYSNTFTQLAGYYGTVALHIRAKTNGVSFIANVDPITESAL